MSWVPEGNKINVNDEFSTAVYSNTRLVAVIKLDFEATHQEQTTHVWNKVSHFY